MRGSSERFMEHEPDTGRHGALSSADEDERTDRGSATRGDLQAPRILIADDLDLNRRLIADMLAIYGYVVDGAANGAAAVAGAQRGVYDLILMDMVMPHMDGIAATRAIRALPPPACNVPIIALTANSFPEQLEQCLGAGMNATLVKPLSMDTLVAAVRQWAIGRPEAA
jgi:CheY-like chemotaxis protein